MTLTGRLDPRDGDVGKACAPPSADGACVHVSILQHCPSVYPIISDDSAAQILCFFHPSSLKKKKTRKSAASGQRWQELPIKICNFGARKTGQVCRVHLLVHRNERSGGLGTVCEHRSKEPMMFSTDHWSRRQKVRKERRMRPPRPLDEAKLHLQTQTVATV